MHQLQLKLSEIAHHVKGKIIGNGPDFIVNRIATLNNAGPEDLSFLTHSKYKSELETTRAGAVLMKKSIETASFKTILVQNPYLALAEIMTLYYPPKLPEKSIHCSIDLDSSVQLGDDVRLGSGVAIGKNVTIGDRTAIFPNVVIADDVNIGSDCIIYPNVTLYHSVQIGSGVIIHAGTVIGSDGFGYAKDGAMYIKIPQIGGVVIEDDVEIGAGCTIDRGSLGTTTICRGVKLDNLIQIAHNVIIGDDTAIASQVGISGSTKVGKRVIMAGQAGVDGHIEIGDDSILTGRCGVTKSVPSKTMQSGFPHKSHRKWLRQQAVLSNAFELKKQLDKLKKKVDSLELEKSARKRDARD